MAKRPGGAMTQSATATRSQLIPIVAKWRELGSRGHFAPVIFCIAAFFALTVSGAMDLVTIPISTLDGSGYVDPRNWIYTSWSLIVVGLFLTMASLYMVYTMVGKRKSWWVLLGAMSFTAYFLWLLKVDHDFLWLYNFFHVHLAGGEPDSNLPFIQLFIQYFLGAGFFEETVKALPCLALVLAARYLSPQVRATAGVEEPLDGILIGAASGGGFAIVETLSQYIPHYLANQWIMASFGNTPTPAAIQALLQMNGQQLLQAIQAGSKILGPGIGFYPLIIRSIDLAFGHMAYAGYFGYFIGLSVIRPQQRWKILGIGLVSASIPHALWDTVADKGLGAPIEAAVAVLSFAILAAAVLKAREISPNRAILQPSMLLGSQLMPALAPAAPGMASPAVAGSFPAPLAAPAPPGGETGAGSGRLRVGSRTLVIVPGLRILEHQAPGVAANASGGAVAEVTRHPADPCVLGLTNLSTTVWEVVSGGGARREIAPGQTVKLGPGVKIDFGAIDGEVF